MCKHLNGDKSSIGLYKNHAKLEITVNQTHNKHKYSDKTIFKVVQQTKIDITINMFSLILMCLIKAFILKQ